MTASDLPCCNGDILVQELLQYGFQFAVILILGFYVPLSTLPPLFLIEKSSPSGKTRSPGAVLSILAMFVKRTSA
jgi:hypothetical protein